MAAWWFAALVGLALLAAIWLCWQSLYRLPHAYDTLERRGVPVNAQATYDAGGRRASYLLTYRFRGRSRETRAFDDLDQFRSLGAFEPVTLLVDPEDPDTAFTAADVRARTSSGIGWTSAFGIGASFALLIALIGAIGWARSDKARIARSETAPEFDATSRTPSWLGERRVKEPLEALEALDALVFGGRRLPPSGEVRVDYAAMRAALAELRASVDHPLRVARARRTPPLLDQLESLLRAAHSGPLIAGASIDVRVTTDLLAEIRHALVMEDAHT